MIPYQTQVSDKQKRKVRSVIVTLCVQKICTFSKSCFSHNGIVSTSHGLEVNIVVLRNCFCISIQPWISRHDVFKNSGLYRALLVSGAINQYLREQHTLFPDFFFSLVLHAL